MLNVPTLQLDWHILSMKYEPALHDKHLLGCCTHVLHGELHGIQVLVTLSATDPDGQLI